MGTDIHDPKAQTSMTPGGCKKTSVRKIGLISCSLAEFAILLFRELGFATRAAICRSLRALRARNHKKVSKKVFLGVRREKSQKYPKKSKNTDFQTFLGIFRLFGYFLRLFCGPPKGPFLRLFCDFGPGGSGDSCKWLLGSQAGVLYFGHFLEAPREPRQLKP